MAAVPTRFLVLVYRMPAKPTAGRVAVWRQLKKIGAIYIQQSVCVFPDYATVRADLQPILIRITEASGEFHLLPVRTLSASEQGKLVDQFLDQTAKHYAEIIENCEVNFQKEVEFEVFRQNFTYEEAEEIRIEFEKIATWFERVKKRDWFGAPNQKEASSWIAKCEHLVEDFEAKVFAVQQDSQPESEAPKRPVMRLQRPTRGRTSGRVSTGRAAKSVEAPNGSGDSSRLIEERR